MPDSFFAKQCTDHLELLDCFSAVEVIHEFPRQFERSNNAFLSFDVEDSLVRKDMAIKFNIF
ncbi:hypothetical protein BKI51_14865 [Alphaproteobacteria bacterium AO1-B]|nr:hypothetical protein BKI51_14865 [Alphaproteobacteria bacterium AO1-B]